MSDLVDRLTKRLEPLLRQPDPRPQISAYHDMPYAIFRYEPDDEWLLRHELSLLRTRLEQECAKRITVVSLADCFREALATDGISADELAQAERTAGLDACIDTVHLVLTEAQPLDELVVSKLPADCDPTRDILFIVRTGALFPMYRTSALLEQLMGRFEVPAVLFYPGQLAGTNGLRFMGILEPEHNYRPLIF